MSRSSDSSSHSGRGSGWAPFTRKTTLTPTNLLKRHSLPIAAYLHTPETPPGLDVSRPLLLYSSYVSTKVRAVSLRLTSDGVILPVGPTLVIPDAYTGWFSIVNSKGLCAMYYSTVEEVASNQVPFFLTRFDIPAYICDEEDDGRTTYHRTVVQSGHVLKLLGVFEDLNARGRSGAASGIHTSKYVQCLNFKNEIIFVPASATGRFYPTATKGSRKTSCVFLLPQILKNFKLPLTVRLICGYMPRVPHNFTGTLRLEKAQKESVILCCTMTPDPGATLLEMDVGSYFLLTPITDGVFQRSPIYLKTHAFCQDEAESWRRQIKVTHHVTEDSSGSSLGRSTSGDNTFDSNNSLKQLSLARLVDFSKRSSRVRERSRTRQTVLRDSSRDKIKLRISRSKENDSKANVQGERKKDKSKDRVKVADKVREKVFDRIQDMSRNSHQAVNEEFISIKMSDTVMKGLKVKKDAEPGGSRKLSKQNTYIFQNERGGKVHDRRKSASSSISSASDVSRQVVTLASAENEDYSLVVDDISHLRNEKAALVGEPEGIYAEICEGKFVSDAESGIVRASRKSTGGGRFWRTHLSEVNKYCSGSSTEDEKYYSFTLLKKDIGGCYNKMGLGMNDSARSKNVIRLTQSYC